VVLLKWLAILHVYRQYDFVTYLLGEPHPALADLDPTTRNALARTLGRDPDGARGTTRQLSRIARASARAFLIALFGRRTIAWNDSEFF